MPSLSMIMPLYSGVWLKIGHPHVPQKHLFTGVPLDVSGSYMFIVSISGNLWEYLIIIFGHRRQLSY